MGKTNQNKSRSFEDSTKNTGKPTIARRLLCLDMEVEFIFYLHGLECRAFVAASP